MNVFYGWSTKKVANGFSFSVVKNTSRDIANDQGRYVDMAVVRAGVCKTRAIAIANAKKIMMQYTRSLAK